MTCYLEAEWASLQMILPWTGAVAHFKKKGNKSATNKLTKLRRPMSTHMSSKVMTLKSNTPKTHTHCMQF